jgi:hypothetical protein
MTDYNDTFVSKHVPLNEVEWFMVLTINCIDDNIAKYIVINDEDFHKLIPSILKLLPPC